RRSMKLLSRSNPSQNFPWLTTVWIRNNTNKTIRRSKRRCPPMPRKPPMRRPIRSLTLKVNTTKNRMMNRPTKNNPSDMPSDDTFASEGQDRGENAQTNATGESGAKPAKRGLRGPRSLRRARHASRKNNAEKDQSSDAPVAGGDDGMRTDVQGEAVQDRPRRQGQQGRPSKQQGRQNQNGGNSRHAKKNDADDVFSFVTSDAFDAMAGGDDHGGKR